MSVRAYKIKKIETEKDCSFNLWHDTKLMEFLDEKGFYEMLNEGSGITEIPVSALEEALKEDLADKDYDNPKEEEKELKKSIKKDIAWAKKRGDDYIQYYCY